MEHFSQSILRNFIASFLNYFSVASLQVIETIRRLCLTAVLGVLYFGTSLQIVCGILLCLLFIILNAERSKIFPYSLSIRYQQCVDTLYLCNDLIT